MTHRSWRCRGCGRYGRIERWESLAYYVGRHVTHGPFDVWPTGERHKSMTYARTDVGMRMSPTFGNDGLTHVTS